MKRPIPIIKASGESVPFSADKLRLSLSRTGADQQAIDELVGDVEKKLYPGIPAKKIYRLAFDLLKKHRRSSAARYKLKNAIMELGPSGYPFEKYIGEILKYQGFKVQTGKIVNGHCVKHEIDVIAEKDEKQFMIECKYHNSEAVICDVKIPLYVHARFRDVEAAWKRNETGEKFYQGWLVTNTRFSLDAIQYGRCSGLHLVGWNFPKHGNLKDLIDESGLYPITCMTTLTKQEKQNLLMKNIVLCKEICNNHRLLAKAGVKESKMESVIREAVGLCEGVR